MNIPNITLTLLTIVFVVGLIVGWFGGWIGRGEQDHANQPRVNRVHFGPRQEPIKEIAPAANATQPAEAIDLDRVTSALRTKDLEQLGAALRVDPNRLSFDSPDGTSGVLYIRAEVA